MKTFYVVVVTFLIAFATSALYELDFFTANWVRFALVTLLILIELVAGALYVVLYMKAFLNQKPVE